MVACIFFCLVPLVSGRALRCMATIVSLIVQRLSLPIRVGELRNFSFKGSVTIATRCNTDTHRTGIESKRIARLVHQ
uniref:Putative secreted protein n=1 Tax=Anopheles marajoara TaxID=58244 RepID=A0A2M4CCL4_9DIPT